METTIKAVHKFYECLKEKGYLAVGHAEPSSLIYDMYVSEIYPDAVIYRRDTTLKKEQQYKTGIRIRRIFSKTIVINRPLHPPRNLQFRIISVAEADREAPGSEDTTKKEPPAVKRSEVREN